MKFTKLINLLTLGAALAFAGAGCRHTPTGVTTLPGITKTTTTTPNFGPEGPTRTRPIPFDNGNGNANANGGDIRPGMLAITGDHHDWNAHPEILAAQTIHFDYDKSAVKSSEHSKLDAVASYLKGHPDAAVRIEGNCDERGTEEYNRSLGERRALAAREYLASQGIDAGRLDTETYGKDKPVATGHDEASFAQNRRDDFVVLTAPGR